MFDAVAARQASRAQRTSASRLAAAFKSRGESTRTRTHASSSPFFWSGLLGLLGLLGSQTLNPARASPTASRGPAPGPSRRIGSVASGFFPLNALSSRASLGGRSRRVPRGVTEPRVGVAGQHRAYRFVPRGFLVEVARRRDAGKKTTRETGRFRPATPNPRPRAAKPRARRGYAGSSPWTRAHRHRSEEEATPESPRGRRGAKTSSSFRKLATSSRSSKTSPKVCVFQTPARVFHGASENTLAPRGKHAARARGVRGEPARGVVRALGWVRGPELVRGHGHGHGVQQLRQRRRQRVPRLFERRLRRRSRRGRPRAAARRGVSRTARGNRAPIESPPGPR